MKMSSSRVVADPIGGSGGKIDILLEHVTAALAMKTRRLPCAHRPDETGGYPGLAAAIP